VVIRTGKKVSTGSCRSIPEFNLIESLTECRELFVEFGGHKGAAGFTMLTQNIPLLQEKLIKIAGTKLEAVDLRPKIDIDAEVTLKELAGSAFRDLQRLAPFGQANPMPVFVSRKVKVVGCRTMGSDGGHLRLKLEQGGMVWDAVGFGFGAHQAEMSAPIDIVYNLELDQWNGKSTLRLNLLDFAQTK
jgi:single-stranded-DNA-specific exonuclease